MRGADASLFTIDGGVLEVQEFRRISRTPRTGLRVTTPAAGEPFVEYNTGRNLDDEDNSLLDSGQGH